MSQYPMKSSGTTNVPGWIVFFREPVEDVARTWVAPSSFIAHRFARWFNLCGGIRWSFPWRGRKMTVSAPRFPIRGGSLGAASRTWTTQADFQSGNLFHLDATSSLGQLMLENAVSPWVKSSANPVLGPGAGWESDWVDSPSVLFEAGVYKMWYQGCVGTVCGIGYATSSDGIGWTRFLGNHVLAPNAAGWDQTLGGPVVVHDGTLYRMWYAGNGPLAIQIGYATSPDGTTWTRYGNAPVFMGLRSWDSAATSTPVVIKVGLQWILYFSGHSGDFVYQMGRATSPDGVNWTEDPLNPLMAPDVPWESSRVHPGGG